MAQIDLRAALLAENPTLVRRGDDAALRADVQQLLLRAPVQPQLAQMRVEAGGRAEHLKQMQTLHVAAGGEVPRKIGEHLSAQGAVHTSLEMPEIAQRSETSMAAVVQTQPVDNPVVPNQDGRHNGLLQRKVAEAIDALLP